jgi:hypothetical protein
MMPARESRDSEIHQKDYSMDGELFLTLIRNLYTLHI